LSAEEAVQMIENVDRETNCKDMGCGWDLHWKQQCIHIKNSIVFVHFYVHKKYVNKICLFLSPKSVVIMAAFQH
jgi:hypothetical protein